MELRIVHIDEGKAVIANAYVFVLLQIGYFVVGNRRAAGGAFFVYHFGYALFARCFEPVEMGEGKRRNLPAVFHDEIAQNLDFLVGHLRRLGKLRSPADAQKFLDNVFGLPHTVFRVINAYFTQTCKFFRKKSAAKRLLFPQLGAKLSGAIFRKGAAGAPSKRNVDFSLRRSLKFGRCYAE